MDLSRSYAISGGAQPKRLQFADNLTRIRGLEAKTNTGATLGVFVDREATGEPDFLLPAQSTTTAAIASAQYVTVANVTPAIADLGSVYLYVVDEPLPASQASLAGQPGLALGNGLSGPYPTSVYGQNVNAQLLAVDDLTGRVVPLRASNLSSRDGILAVVPWTGVGGAVSNGNAAGIVQGGNWQGNVEISVLMGNAPNGANGSLQLIAADRQCLTDPIYGHKSSALLVSRGGNQHANVVATAGVQVRSPYGVNYNTNGPLRLCKVQVLVAGTVAVSIYDGVGAAGDVVCLVPATAAAGEIFDMDVICDTGMYVAGVAGGPTLLITYYG